jgi:hypothetical protein
MVEISGFVAIKGGDAVSKRPRLQHRDQQLPIQHYHFQILQKGL